MLDQAFSAKNLRRIYDLENRRGRNVDREFFPDLLGASAKVSAKSERIRDVRRDNGTLPQDALDALLSPLQAELQSLRRERDIAIDATVEALSAEIRAKGFQLSLGTLTGPASMDLHPLERNAASYFVAKQLQNNLSRLYKLRPANRRHIVAQLSDILSTKFKLHIVRTDITSFYESVDRAALVKEIDKDQLLSLGSKSHIKCILSAYGEIVGSANGLPRGVGVSAYLSELYMRFPDERIKQLNGLVYYARYVDDIIAIFAPTAMDDVATYLPAMRAIMLERGLALNPAKTVEGTVGPATVANFEYLGYSFSVTGGTCSLEMTPKKHARYKARIDKSFEAYERGRAKNQKSAARSLVSRIKYLTGNTRLVNSKRHAYVGVYYSNSSLTKLGKLTALDAYLKHKVNQLDSANLQNQIDHFSFVRGFKERPFCRYSTKSLSKIVRVWRYEA